MADETVLALSGVGVPPYSARGLIQTLEPIPAATSLRRTVNGELDDLSDPAFRKYQSVISGNDQQPPACDGVWPGRLITVDCIAELCYLTSGGSPERPVVSGSSRTEGLFTFYRPQLSMRVVSSPAISRDEYSTIVTWNMNLEEA